MGVVGLQLITAITGNVKLKPIVWTKSKTSNVIHLQCIVIKEAAYYVDADGPRVQTLTTG